MAPGRILVVDDERLFREMYRDTLVRHGYEVATASSAQEALATLAADRTDLLLTDVRMPGMDGIGLCAEALRRDPALEAVAVTAAGDLDTAVRAMQAGAGDFLVKPVQEERLVQAAARALARARLRREHGRLLDENLEFVRSQSLLQQSLAILSTLDLELLQDQLLQVLASATDAQGGALWVADDRGQLTLRAYRGLVDRSALPVRLELRDAERGLLADGQPRRGDAFELPLRADDELVGLCLLTDRARGRFGEEERAAAAAVGRFAAIALRNARRHQALERVGLKDRETSAYNLAYFVDYAGKEFYKARRYGRSFSLAVLTVDGAERLRREGGREAWRAATRGLVAAVGRAVRDADILARMADTEYYVLLPETDHFGARMFARRAADEVRKEPSLRAPSERAAPLLSLGVATFPRDGEDFDELVHHARLRQEEQRRSLARRLPLDGLSRTAFWELCDLLLADGQPLADATSARRPADAELFGAALREAARELGRDPRARGLLYLGSGDRAAVAALVQALPAPGGNARSGDGAPRVVLLGPQPPAPGHPLVAVVPAVGERRFETHQFLIFLSEQSAYALLQDSEGRAFHTADGPLVDALASRLQALHDLEPA
ncbi:MAG: response regulator [Deltaproteobacteria bacterium]|nr:response regulator [Deltaproteobacteria bacterium]